ncbi:MAG: hypothetical protein HYS89_02080 [Candidatus Colwellbacteria bacterium]|nr:hypothetical protein [Candidatus Colwellbacteria bacterium]
MVNTLISGIISIFIGVLVNPFLFIPRSDLGANLYVYPGKESESKLLEETGNQAMSQNSDWWLNSGGLIFWNGESGRTIQGALSIFDKWRQIYQRTNSLDTDNGEHPQNIFRLVSRNELQSLEQEVYFKINRINLSQSPNRNQSNGVLFFNRYLDGDNLYYVGLRVDGQAVIKKKINGIYYTMAITPVYKDGFGYNRDSNPNLLPENQWIGIRSRILNDESGKVNIELFIDKEGNGNWVSILKAEDNGKYYGGKAIKNAGRYGIRTDFMDVEFEGYKVASI